MFTRLQRPRLRFLAISLLLLPLVGGLPFSFAKEESLSSQRLEHFDGHEKLAEPVKQMILEEQLLHVKGLWPKGAFSSNIDPAYIPENQPKFALPYYLVPVDETPLLKTSSLDPAIEKQLQVEIRGVLYSRLFVHPESEGHYKFLREYFPYVDAVKSEFLATPTSSYRSLVVWNQNGEDKPFIAKLSLDRDVISGIDRLVSEAEVRRSLANQEAFDRLGSERLEKAAVRIYPESAGLVLDPSQYRRAPKKLGGLLIREIPEDVLRGKKRFVSFAALMSPERPQGEPLMVEIIRNQKQNPVDFLRRYLVHSYMRTFTELSLRQGINFEPHSQNLSWELDPRGQPTGRWVIRDFGGVWPDILQMSQANGPVDTYAKEGGAQLYKLQGGRVNSISSYVFFYRRQVFDMMLDEVGKFFPEVKSAKASLRNELDRLFLEAVGKHLGLQLRQAPTMENYKSIEKKLAAESRLVFDPQRMREFSAESLPGSWLAGKKSSGDWVVLSQDSGSSWNPFRKTTPTKFWLSADAIFEVDKSGQVRAFALLTSKDKKTRALEPIFRALPLVRPKAPACGRIWGQAA